MPEPDTAGPLGAEPSSDQAPGPTSDPDRDHVGGEDGRSRLLRALRSPFSRGQAIAAVLLVVVGFAAAVQIRSAGSDDRFSAASEQDLINFINALTLANDRTEQEIEELQQTRTALRDDTEASRTAVELAQRQVTSLGILAGTVAATGPGVRVTVTDPSGSVGTDQVLEGIEELRDAGAEAIEINDRVRVVAQTGVTDGPDGLVVGGVPLDPPYVIEAIGSPATLASGLDFSGGFVDGVTDVGGRVDIEEQTSVDIATVLEPSEPRFSRPDGGE